MSNKPKPRYYELEFSSDATFWTEGDVSTRRVYLMPVPTPSEFLAFGVLAPSKKVLFVARGRLREELGGFVARMVRDGATVELYAKPPLPASLVNAYLKGPPHEGHEYDEPPESSNPGITSTRGALKLLKPKKDKKGKKLKPVRSSASR